MTIVTPLLVAVPTALILWGFVRNVPALCAAGGALAAFVLVAYAFTAFRDPGVVARSLQPTAPDQIFDENALSYRPRSARYDYESETLLMDIDHFCPWVGTTVARNNLCAFRVFTNSLCALILFAIAVAVWSVASGSGSLQLALDASS